MTRIADARSLDELYSFSDADIPAFKRMAVGMREAGNPLQLPPSVAAAAIAKGFEEGVHFDITRPIPRTEIVFITDGDVVKSPGDW